MERNVIVSRAKYDIIPENKDIHKGKANMCVDTGELFVSVMETHDLTGIPYATLIAHLNGKTKTCHGLHFCYISEMSYKANDIANCIMEMKQNSVSKDDYVAAIKRNKELKAELEELKMQTSETKIEEDFNSIMETVEKNNRAMEKMMRHLLTMADKGGNRK